MCPTLHFDKGSLDFGAVALGTPSAIIDSGSLSEIRSLRRAFAGFSKRQDVHLRNLSLVPVSFGATITEDGDQAPLTHEEFARSEAQASFPTNPREFTIVPQKGIVEACSSLKLKVNHVGCL